MKYIIMIAIVLGLAIADFATGIIKAYVNHDLSSQKMRKGGLNKLTELVVMATACGLEIGIGYLGRYYHSAELAAVAGAVAATILNTPWTFSGFMAITIPLLTTTTFMQFVLPSTMTGKWYRRRYTQGAWSAWIEYDGIEVTS